MPAAIIDYMSSKFSDLFLIKEHSEMLSALEKILYTDNETKETLQHICDYQLTAMNLDYINEIICRLFDTGIIWNSSQIEKRLLLKSQYQYNHKELSRYFDIIVILYTIYVSRNLQWKITGIDHYLFTRHRYSTIALLTLVKRGTSEAIKPSLIILSSLKDANGSKSLFRRKIARDYVGNIIAVTKRFEDEIYQLRS